MKPAETVSEPRANPGASRKRNAGSRVCARGVECFTLAWVAGLLSAFLQYGSAAAVAGLCLLSLGLLSLLWKDFPRKYRTGMLCICAGLLLSAAVWLSYDMLHRRPLLQLDGQTVTLCGTVRGSTQRSSDRVRYTLDAAPNGHRTQIEWYAGSDVPPLKIGDRVTLQAELTRYTSDYRYHTAESAEARGQYLSCFRAKVVNIDADTGFSLRRTLHEYRSRLTDVIRQHMSGESAGLLLAMLFGDKAALSDDAQLALYRTGIGHVTAVSGLHLVFLCTLLTWLLRRLHAGPRTLLLVNGAAVLLFSVMVDSAVSVQRGTVMILLYYSAPLLGRKTDTLRSLCIAMLLCTVFTPYVIGSASFWLSVSGVFGIGIAAPYMTRNLRVPRGLRHFLQLCCVAAAVFPASLLLTGESSLLAPVCNLLILPFGVCAVYLGLLLLCTGGLTAFLLPVAGLLCSAMMYLAELAASLPFSHVGAATLAVRTALIILTLTVLLLFALRASPKYIAAAVLCAAIVLFGLGRYERQLDMHRIRIAVLGEKTDTALVLRADGHTVIADLTGGSKTPAYVQRFLRDNALTDIDALVLSSAANAAGYQSVLTGCAVGRVVVQTGEPWRADAEICGVRAEFAEGGMVSADFPDFSFDSMPLNTTVMYHGRTVIALPADGHPVYADIVIRYGEGEVPTDNLGLQIVPALQGGNQLLTLTEDGRLRRVMLE